METITFPDIFSRIKKQLLPYGKKMDTRIDKEGNYQLYIKKKFELAGRSYKECYFCGLMLQKTMVSLHYFPIYTHPKEFSIPDPIKKNLKGKSCFNFKKLDDAQEKALQQLLKQGYDFYKTFLKLK